MGFYLSVEIKPAFSHQFKFADIQGLANLLNFEGCGAEIQVDSCPLGDPSVGLISSLPGSQNVVSKLIVLLFVQKGFSEFQKSPIKINSRSPQS